MKHVLLMLCGCVMMGTVAPGTVAQGADQFALVIGNSNYQGARLRNPVHDADALSTALQKLNFDVTTLKDVDIDGFDRGLRNFKAKLTPKSVAIFFFAGHGVQVDGNNYLLPLKHNVQEKHEVRRKCIQVDNVLKLMDQSPSTVNILILDACRNNPFERSWTRSANGQGFAAMRAFDSGSEAKTTVIAFSTARGEVAADGDGDNSPYTKQLVTQLASLPPQGMEIIRIFRNASQEVFKSTKQRPFLDFSAYSDDFYLKPPAGTGRPSAPGNQTLAGNQFSGSHGSSGADTLLLLPDDETLNELVMPAPGKSSPPVPSFSGEQVGSSGNGNFINFPAGSDTSFSLQLPRLLLQNSSTETLHYVTVSIASFYGGAQAGKVAPGAKAAVTLGIGESLYFYRRQSFGRAPKFDQTSDAWTKIDTKEHDTGITFRQRKTGAPQYLTEWTSTSSKLTPTGIAEWMRLQGDAQREQPEWDSATNRVLIVNRSKTSDLHIRSSNIPQQKLKSGEAAAVTFDFPFAGFSAHADIEAYAGGDLGWVKFEIYGGKDITLELTWDGKTWQSRKTAFDEDRWTKVLNTEIPDFIFD